MIIGLVYVVIAIVTLNEKSSVETYRLSGSRDVEGVYGRNKGVLKQDSSGRIGYVMAKP